MITDAALLGRFAGTGDETALGELVHRHLDAVYSASLRRVGGDRQLAEDVTQRVFLELARQARVLLQVETLSRLACGSAESSRRGPADAKNVDWEVIDAQARVLLTPEQFAAFSQFEHIGPSGTGGRHFYLLHASIDKAWAADKAAKTTTAATAAPRGA